MKTYTVYRTINRIIYFAVFLGLYSLLNATLRAQVVLTVTAEGTAPFSYQWTKDDAPIAGATAASIVATTSGSYAATVSNSAGSTVSTPTSLTLNAAVSYAPDYSKQYARAHLISNYSPPVAQLPNWAVVPLKRTFDPGNHFNDATGIYTVGAGEGGEYTVFIVIRTQDQPPPGVSIGLTAGVTDSDDGTLWTSTPPKSDAYMRFGAEHTVPLTLSAGDKVRANIFVQSALLLYTYDVTFRRVN